MKQKRKAYKATQDMLTSPVLAHMRAVAYTPVSINNNLSEAVEISIIEKNLEKHNRKEERNIRNANRSSK